MRDLTDTEVAAEVAKIDQEADWPLAPVLPVKHIHRAHPDYSGPRIGLIVAGERTVYFMPLSDLKTGEIEPQLKGVRHEEFANTEHLVRSGWIGD